ncbi:V-type ATP synthase subunit D [Treponema pedis]|uniref:V-type ATP synthase subunit D n=1 Tax=Treponema pedis TaxID=409322 RepID=A0A7S6WQS4_9SPIR|nr:V-type ATP synthase subunit D [Treponema pedis]QOW61600.1 V-type ATP synthase subunit D [Treponema pedis]QSI03832.1 V-type ATP synthase subunit D [Treponema pedis]
MAKLNIAPTKSNLLSLTEQLRAAKDGYDLLEQKREILVMELMKMLDKVKILEKEINKQISVAYPALRRMFIAVGRNETERLAKTLNYEFRFTEKTVTAAGIRFASISAELPKRTLAYSYLDSFADCDKVMIDFFKLLDLLTEMASIRTIVWRLAGEVKKTQRRVNALDKQVIPQTSETKTYIESVLEERERENVFVLKALKSKAGKTV